MSFRLGIAGLCTSHPMVWTPIIKELVESGFVDLEINAVWDSAEVKDPEFVGEFREKFGIPHIAETLEDMLELVDGVIIHTANWDKHIEQAKVFLEAGKSVYLDKPVVGNLGDAGQLMDWAIQGMRITGGSSLRYTKEVREYLAQPIEERGTPHTVYAACGTDEFNYGIHAYSLLSSVMGPGIRSVKYLGSSGQKQIMINWSDGRIGLLTIGENAWLPFCMTAVTDKKIEQIEVEISSIYRSLLEKILPYLTGAENEAPLPMGELLEPELAAMAARVSWMNNGAEVFLSDLRQDDPGYDGTQFAIEYRRKTVLANK